MKKQINNESIEILNIPDKLINILKKNDIDTIDQLCQKRNKDLKMMNIEQNESSKINVELQLLGFSLKGSL